MGLFDKIRGIFKESSAPAVPEVERIELKQLSKKIDAHVKEQTKNEDRIRKDLSLLIKNLDSSLRSSINDLESIDLNKKKEHEKVKQVVIQNLNVYVANLKRLLDNLAKIDQTDIRSQINKILKYFKDFEKASHLPYHKATILIGKEMEKVTNQIKGFSSDFNKLLTQNKEFFESSTEMTDIKTILHELEAIDSSKEEIAKNNVKLNDSIEDNNGEIETSRDKMDQIRASEDYKSDIVNNEQFKIDLEYLSNNIQTIKPKVNLKSLAKRFHSDKVKSKLVAEYIKDFKTAIKNDVNLEIISLIKEDQGVELLELKGIREHVVEYEKERVFKTFQAISILEENIKDLEAKNAEIKAEIEENNKKVSKLDTKKVKLTNDLRKLTKIVFPFVEII